MTDLLQRAIAQIEKLPPDEQDAIALRPLAELADDYDFSKAEWGKFYHPEAVFSFPIYLDPDVNEFLSRLAEQKQVDVQELVNNWLRADMRLSRVSSDGPVGEATFDIDLREEVFTVALVPELADVLESQAKARGVTTETLVNLWLAERLRRAA